MPRIGVVRVVEVGFAALVLCLTGMVRAAGAQVATGTVEGTSGVPSAAPSATTSAAPSTAPSTAPPAGPAEESKAWIPPDWSQMIPELVATFTGALLALLTALRLERGNKRRADAAEQAARAD